jgi:hypothetical protein
MKLKDVLKDIGISIDDAYIPVQDLDLLSGDVVMDCDDGYRLCVKGEVAGPVHIYSHSAVRDGLKMALIDIYRMSIEERMICFNQSDASKVNFLYIMSHYSGDELLAIRERHRTFLRNYGKQIEDAKNLLIRNGYELRFVGKEETE